MTFKLKYPISLLVLLFFISSCEKNDLGEVVTESTTTVDEAAAFNLIFSETFESPVPLYTVHGTDFAAPHSFRVVSKPVFKGLKSARFELRDTDPMISSGTRAEITVVKDSVEKEMWYSFATYFPADKYKQDRETELISQWHQAPDKHLGEKSHSPATQLLIKNDRFILDTGFNKDQVSTEVYPESRKKIDLGQVTKDTWHEFVFHFVHSFESEGLIEIWHNGQKILTHTGGNMNNDVAMPKWKLGIYKWKWNGNETTDTQLRVLYFDNIKVGNSTASLAEMLPGAGLGGSMPGSIPPFDPTPERVADLTLVNCHTDTDVKKVADGEIISLAALGTNKISFRANTSDSKTASVKFVVTGAKNYSYADKQMPYALFGDDGLGNYFYGSYLPEGNYTLQVIPFDDPKAKGLAGKPYTINFTVVR